MFHICVCRGFVVLRFLPVSHLPWSRFRGAAHAMGLRPEHRALRASICGTPNLGAMCKLAALKQAHCLIPNLSVPRARRSDWGADPWHTLHREYLLCELHRRGESGQ
jgi:hypothetical protein